MKRLLICMLAAAALLASGATDETISFRTLDGITWTNARVVRSDVVSITVMQGTAGARVSLTNCPAEVQARYHYDAAKAAELLAAEAQRAANYRAVVAADTARLAREQAAALDYKKRRDAFLAGLQWLQGEVVQREKGVVHLSVTWQRARYWSNGRVSGSSSAATSRLAVKNHPQYEFLRTGQTIGFWASKGAGDYSYTSVVGDPVSIEVADCAVPAEFATDKLVIEALRRPGVWQN